MEIIFDYAGPPSSLMFAPKGVHILHISWSTSINDISYEVDVRVGNLSVDSLTTNSTSLLFTPSALSCSPYQIRVRAFNEVGQETDYGESIDVYIISDTSE